MVQLHTVARTAVFSVFCLTVLIATAGWLVRSRRVSPFTGTGRALRRVSDPFLNPVERRFVRAGGSPLHAGWWLVIGVALAGVLLLSVLDWAARLSLEIASSAHGGVRPLLELAVVV